MRPTKHSHFYKWSAIKAHRAGGPKPRCVMCKKEYKATPRFNMIVYGIYTYLVRKWEQLTGANTK